MKNLFFILLLICCLSSSSAQYKIGDIVDDLSAISYDEETDVSLDDFEEQEGLVVVFTSALCAEARAYTGRLMDLQKRYAPQGYPIVAIDISSQEEDRDEEKETKVEKYVNEEVVNFLYAIDPDKDLFETFGPSKVPCAYVLKNQLEDDNDPGYKVIYYGAIDDSPSTEKVKVRYVEDAIKHMMKKHKISSLDDDGGGKKKKKKTNQLKSNPPFGCAPKKL